MGNTCCTSRASDAMVAGGLTPLDGVGVTDAENIKFSEELLERYKFHRIDFNTHGGETESAILVDKSATPGSSNPIILQKF